MPAPAQPVRLIISIIEADETVTERTLTLPQKLSRFQQATLLDILAAIGRGFLGPPNRVARVINQL
jgi:hypothetical protein